jgi:signal transduction histidine kinase
VEVVKMPKILVVEDEVAIAEEIIDRLEGLGFGVSGTASSGEDAIKKAEETRPDLVLMDIKLEGDMDGVEAAEQIRASLDVPVVYLTAFSDRKALERAKVTEPFGYIVKPFEERVLEITIEMALHKHEKEKELRERLLKAHVGLKSVDDVKDDIIYNVSHELRTPIQIAVGAIELAGDDGDGHIPKYLEIAKDALMKQDKIVEDLIQLSEHHKGELKLKKENINLNVLIKNAVEVVKKAAGNREITVEKGVPDVTISADPKKVKRALLNVLDNAIKFTDDGGNISVSMKNGNGSVEIVVKDTGEGISREHLDRIFDRLFQIDASATRRFEGTGSGLAVAKYIVELHDGRMWVESKGTGKGSSFHVKLPVK